MAAANISIESTLQSDEAKHYIGIGRGFEDHQSANHKAGG
jgi:hypothetical protein